MKEAQNVSAKPHDLKSLEPIWAYTFFGLMLGTLPPATALLAAAVFGKPVEPAEPNTPDVWRLFTLVVFLCSITGLGAGAFVGLLMSLMRKSSWKLPVSLSPFFGFVWGIVTGGAGGFPVFIVGAIFGMIIAAPFGVAGFLLFAAFYEPLTRGRNLLWWQILSAGLLLPLILTLVAAAINYIFNSQ
jgi:hypothetical protein